MFHVSLPVVGALFSSLENKFILKNIMSGGFFDKTKLPDSYLNLLCTSLKRKYVYHFRNVLSQFNKNNGIKELYKKVDVRLNFSMEVMIGLKNLINWKAKFIKFR